MRVLEDTYLFLVFWNHSFLEVFVVCLFVAFVCFFQKQTHSSAGTSNELCVSDLSAQQDQIFIRSLWIITMRVAAVVLT